MAFGDTATLRDNFNRVLADGLGADWTEPMFSADTTSDLDISSNRVVSNAGSGVRSNAYYNVAQFGPDLEAYITYSTGTQANRISEICGRIHEFSSTSPDGYCVRVAAVSGTDAIRIFRIDDGAYTQLGADLTATELVGGDKLGIEIIGSNITAYHQAFGSGTWTNLGTRTDITYNTAGNVGLVVNHSNPTFDDFFAGTVGGGGGGGDGLTPGRLQPMGIIF